MTESPSPGPVDGHADAPQAHELPDAELQAFWKQALASAPATGLAPERLTALRQRILAAAAHPLATPGHAQPATSPSVGQRLRLTVQKLLDRQGRPPQWAAGLASVCIACLVLMIWYGRWPEAALEDSPPAHQASPTSSAAHDAHAPLQPEPLPAPAYAPAPAAAMPSEAARSKQQAPAETIAADATAVERQPHGQRNSFAAPLPAAALEQPLAHATHWRWATPPGQGQAAATPLSESVRTALRQALPSAQQAFALAHTPEQAQHIQLLHEQQVLLQIWLAPGHIQWQPADADGLTWLAQPSADAYNRLMRALATDASQPKSQ